MSHMSLMPYRDFAPTGFDARGAFLDDRQDWLVLPVTRTRDSGPFATSNFECAWARIEDASVMDDSLSCESHSFGHWGPGWFEIIIVRPDSACEREARAIADELENYPILDEHDYSERVWEDAQETWAHCYNVRERLELIQEHNRHHPEYPVSIFAARHSYIPPEECGHIFDRCRPEE